MKLPRLSIAETMTIVGIAALNVAATRTFPNDDHELLIGVAPMAVFLQFAIFSLIRRRGRVRAFGAGFLVFGTMSMTSFIGAEYFCPSESVSIDPRTGKAVVTTSLGSPIWVLWSSYGGFVHKTLERLPNSDFILGDGGDSHGHDGIPLGTKAVVLSLPQMVLAVAGGLCFSLIKRRSHQPPTRGRTPSQRSFDDVPSLLEPRAVIASYRHQSSAKSDKGTSSSGP
jgi:hypothetical protein